jgi:hypothetical protein
VAKVLLDRTVALAGLAGADRRPLRFTPHDFRRILVTEAVATGLPVHIAAKLLGHESLATTQAYVAVYDQDVIDHHRAFIARRRALRPSVEYWEPTDAEWDEFLTHFERRKVELGVCGRAYGTPCQHEHACIRCPMLRPDPAQQPRLVEIIENLNARLAEAHERGWLGEVEGLEASLAGAEQKLATMRRIPGSAAASIRLGSSRDGLKGPPERREHLVLRAGWVLAPRGPPDALLRAQIHADYYESFTSGGISPLALQERGEAEAQRHAPTEPEEALPRDRQDVNNMPRTQEVAKRNRDGLRG